MIFTTHMVKLFAVVLDHDVVVVVVMHDAFGGHTDDGPANGTNGGAGRASSQPDNRARYGAGRGGSTGAGVRLAPDVVMCIHAARRLHVLCQVGCSGGV